MYQVSGSWHPHVLNLTHKEVNYKLKAAQTSLGCIPHIYREYNVLLTYDEI